MDPLTDSDFRLRHEIFVFDAYLQAPLDSVNREPHARAFIQSILRLLHMEPLAPLQFKDAIDDRAPGWSFIQAITTSHISCHYFEKPGHKPHIRIDFYSCQSVDWHRVVEIAHEYFLLDQWEATFIERYLADEGQRKIFAIRGKGNHVYDEQCVLDGAIASAEAPLVKAAPVLI